MIIINNIAIGPTLSSNIGGHLIGRDEREKKLIKDSLQGLLDDAVAMAGKPSVGNLEGNASLTIDADDTAFTMTFRSHSAPQKKI